MAPKRKDNRTHRHTSSSSSSSTAPTTGDLPPSDSTTASSPDGTSPSDLDPPSPTTLTDTASSSSTLTTDTPISSELEYRSSSTTLNPSASSSHRSHRPPRGIPIRQKTLLIHTHQYTPPLLQPTTHKIVAYQPPILHKKTKDKLTKHLLITFKQFPGSQAPAFHKLDIIGSPNGIVCVVEYDFSTTFTLWNPATGSTTPLPPPALIPQPDRHVASSAGLAFNQHRNDYKAIRILRYDPSLSIPDQVELFSLRSGRWQTLTLPPDAIFWVTRDTCDAVVKGKPHWTAEVNDESAPGTKRSVMLSFDVYNDAFVVTPLDVKMAGKEVCIGEITKNRVGAVLWEKEPNPTEFLLEVWRKEERRGGGWSQLYLVGITPGWGRVLAFYGDNSKVVIEGPQGAPFITMHDHERKAVDDTVVIFNAMPGSYQVVRYTEKKTVLPRMGRN